jgi:hypothetical protein
MNYSSSSHVNGLCYPSRRPCRVTCTPKKSDRTEPFQDTSTKNISLSSILILNDCYLRIRSVIDAVVVVGYAFAGHGKASIHTFRTSEDSFDGSRCLCGGCSWSSGCYRNRQLNCEIEFSLKKFLTAARSFVSGDARAGQRIEDVGSGATLEVNSDVRYCPFAYDLNELTVI